METATRGTDAAKLYGFGKNRIHRLLLGALVVLLMGAGPVRAQCGWDPGNDTYDLASPIGGCSQGSYCLDSQGDVDYYSFTPDQDGMLTFETLGSTDTFMSLRNSLDQEMTSNDDGGEGSNALITREVTGGTTYLIRVEGYSSTTTGAYDFKISGCCGSDPYNNDFAHATTYGGGIISEHIDCGGDLDMYRFTSTVAGTYTFQFSTVDSLVWTYYDSGHVQQDAYSNVASRDISLGVNEDVFIAVKGFQSDDTGSYTLQNTGSTGSCGTDPGDDDSDHATDLGSSCSTHHAGIDCSDDIDFYTFTAPRDANYTFDVSAMNSYNITLYSSVGDLLQGPSGSAVTEWIYQNEVVYVRVMAGVAGESFDYDLEITGCQCGLDPGNDTSGTATNLNGQCGTTHEGVDCAGDVDWFRFTAPSDSTVTFETTGSLDTFMELWDDQQFKIAENDDGGSGQNALISYSVSMGSTYFVKVRAYSGTATGSYDLVVSGCSCGTDPGDYDQNHATDLGGSCGDHAAAIDCTNDDDWYAFTPPNSGTFTFATSAGANSCLLSLYAGGHRVEIDTNSVSHSLTAGDQVFLLVQEDSSAPFDYTLNVSGCSGGGCPGDPGNDTLQTATNVGSSCGSTSAGIDCADDIDFYFFTAPNAGSFTFDISAVNSYSIALYNSSGSLLEGPSGSSVSHSLSANDQVFVRVMAGISGETFNYDLVISGCTGGGCGSDPGNDNLAAATALSGCGTTSAAIDCTGDWDYYWLNAPNGGSFTFETTGSTDTMLTLYDANGSVIDSDDDSGTDHNARIVYTLTSGAKYFVAVNEYNNDATGAYDLAISGCSGGGCGSDPGNDTGQTATNVGNSCGSTSAAIDCADDIDFYSFTAPSTGSFTFDVSATNSYNITLYDGSGSLLEGPSGSAVSHSLSANEQVFVRVMAGINGETFNYDLAISGCSGGGCGSDPGNDTSGTATDLNGQCGTTHEGVDCAGDVDWFRFTAPSDSTVTFETTGSLDTFMELWDDQQSKITEDDDGGSGQNALISYAVSMGSTYFVKVRAYSGTATGSYDLVVSGCSCGTDPGDYDQNHATDLGGSCGDHAAAMDCTNDDDWYAFTPPNSGTFTFATSAGANSCLLSLYAGGHRVEIDTNSVSHSLAAGDQVFLLVQEDSSAPFDYTLNVSGCSGGGCPGDPGNDSVAHATLLPSCGAMGEAINCSGDTDFFTLIAPNDGTYTFDVAPTGKADLILYDSVSSVLDMGSDQVSGQLTSGQQVWIQVSAQVAGDTFSYAFTASGCGGSTCGTETPNDDPANATVLADCGTHDSAFDCANDVDYFVFVAPTTNDYTFETAGTTDTRLWLDDNTGLTMAFDDDGGPGLNARVEALLTAGQTYYVHLEEYGGNTGQYSLSISGCSNCAGDPGNDTLADATQLPGVGTYGAAFDCPGDVDFYALPTVQGGLYTISTTGSMDTQIQLQDSTGRLLAEDDGGGTDLNARVSVTLPAGGSYGIRVSEYGSDATGAYNLEIRFDPGTASYHYLIPASAKAAGVAGTNWSTDLVLVNIGEQVGNVEIAALIRDQANPNPTTVTRQLAAGAMLRSEDVLVDLFGLTGGAAALEVTSDQPLVVGSRTFNAVSEGTFGQFIPGIFEGRLIGAGSKVYLQGMIENSSFRTNLGLVNMEDHSIDVQVIFHEPDGTRLGQVRTYTLEPKEYIQRTQVLRDVTSSEVNLAWAELSANGTFAAYMSEVDFASGDPIYRPVAALPSGSDPVILMGIAKVAGGAGTNWVSDGVFLNPGGATAKLQVDLRERDSTSGQVQTTSFFLNPGSCYSLSDILHSLFGRDAGAASLVVRPDASVLADARTYNMVSSGTFGQNIPAMGTADLLDSTVVGVLAMPRQDSAFRTNVGLMNNLPAASTEVDLVLRDSSGNQLGSTWNLTLDPGEVTQLNAVITHFTSASVSEAYLEIQVVSGSLLAYGSVVDQHTGDPVYEVPSIHLSGSQP